MDAMDANGMGSQALENLRGAERILRAMGLNRRFADWTLGIARLAGAAPQQIGQKSGSDIPAPGSSSRHVV